jgi:acylpyruvate hydrolase
MRLATIAIDGGTTAVVVLEGADAAPVDGYADVGALLRAGEDGMAAARAAAANGHRTPLPQDDAFRRPVTAPGAIVCVGLNYRTHILEMGRDLPEHPTLFSKLPRSLTDPYADVPMPGATEKVDFEGELAVVVGRGGRDIAPDDAWDHIAGVTVLNDVTARDLQKRTLQWFAGKTLQDSTPMGPWIVTPDEFGEAAGHELLVTVNGEERQRADLGDLVFDVPTLVADLSQIIELEPGDVIATGTPGGVGVAEGRFLADGDVVEVSIEGIGTIRNTFREAPR